ncbi:endolytic transglycosylase MltG [Mucilaginibacter myungsuensis]|uniref:Endolytic murein transglycosylase n=1 Tax=Mucilaginibacter myungsuensis TaxID=649104 RepID=A0A929L5K2_9SPHI|nr:endolytic transglycosylase MltG [Mucilaginibacter myungsuensis]MBE9663616.1 endolytic transglycosylase MltG [Mucilaginibacter myungsuensis]MDN3599060.1 endolytic transglycosylase MltG [Mucilaginibacter myungsuensis]
MSNQQPSSGRFKKFIFALVGIIILALGGTGLFYYLRFFGPNVTDNKEYLYIRTGATYQDVLDSIKTNEIVKDTTTFKWAAENMKYTGRVKPGRYRLDAGMSNRALINRLASGTQEPVKIKFTNFRLKEQFAAFLGKHMEPDSAAFYRLIDSARYVEQFGFNTDNVYVMFMPDSYEMYWNTTPEKLFKRMHTHYTTFWTAERKQKAEAQGLTPIQASILASIVDSEALFDDEMPTIAGLYLNRLHKGILLQADPTVIFAVHDFTIRRVLNKHLVYNSPYNTYIYKGLPPGPIMMPSVNAVKAVLDPVKSNYIFMVAKEDFSGRHNFAANEAEHNINAKKFRKALDARNIKK